MSLAYLGDKQGVQDDQEDDNKEIFQAPRKEGIDQNQVEDHIAKVLG